MATQCMETDVRSHKAYGVKPEDNGKNSFKSIHSGNLLSFTNKKALKPFNAKVQYSSMITKRFSQRFLV